MCVGWGGSCGGGGEGREVRAWVSRPNVRVRVRVRVRMRVRVRVKV